MPLQFQTTETKSGGIVWVFSFFDFVNYLLFADLGDVSRRIAGNRTCGFPKWFLAEICPSTGKALKASLSALEGLIIFLESLPTAPSRYQ